MKRADFFIQPWEGRRTAFYYAQNEIIYDYAILLVHLRQLFLSKNRPFERHLPVKTTTFTDNITSITNKLGEELS